MRALFLASALAASAWTSALATSLCNGLGGDTIFHCPLDGSSRTVTICRVQGGDFLYRYGKPGKKPELELRRSTDQVDFQPWNGIGRYIWATLSLFNNGYRYQVAFSADKNTGTTEGFLNVFEPGADEPTLSRSCRANSLTNALDGLELQ